MSPALKARIVTALVLGLGFAAMVLWLPPAVTVAVLSAFVLAGAWEWSGFLRLPGRLVRYGYVLLVAALLPIAWFATSTPESRDLLLLIAVSWWIVALGWILFVPHRANPAVAAIAGVLALVPAWLALMRLRLDVPQGAQWMLFALVLVWAADIGAFFVGKRFGRRRLAPNVSPGKTWEGALGGIAAAGLFALAGSAWFDVPAAVFLPLCLVAAVFSIIGDLTESLLKRHAGVKDSGALFPGHGGVMDRIDSVTAAAPVLFFGLTFLGVAT